MKTLAAILVGQREPLRLVELELPALKSGQVLVDIAFSGICHTQLNEWKGTKGPDRFIPHTMGHEGSGIVSQVGPDVTKVRVGDAVVLSWIKGSGADVPSTVYQSAAGPVNSGAISTFMERAIISENRLTPVPAGVRMREAALLGCAVPTGAGIVFNTAKGQAGQSVAILGAGGIGFSALIAAVALSMTPIIVVDINPVKLQKALEYGATHVIDAGKEDVAAMIKAITAGRGVDLAVECAGTVETMETAFDVIRAGGGLSVLAGNLPAGRKISIDPFQLIAGKRLLGTWGGESQPDRDIPLFGQLYAAGRMPLEGLISQEYPLSDINQAFTDLDNGKVIRAMINLSRRPS